MSSDARARVLDRIQALLSKTVGNGCTEAEAQAAAAKASRLLAEHQLSMAEVEGHRGDESGYATGVAWEGDAYDQAAKYVGPLVVRFWFVRMIRQRPRGGRRAKYAVFGRPEAVEAASWAFNYLRDAFGDLWGRYQVRTLVAPRDRPGFYHGVYSGFRDRMAEERAALERERGAGTGTALARIDDDLDAALKEQMGDLPGLRRRATETRTSVWADGYAEGRKLRVARPVGESAWPALEG
jgi:hypothetical protein